MRYPVKSMAGIAAEEALLGWHGLAGDRRFAFRRLGEAGGFPWLSASRLPELLLYEPIAFDDSRGEPLDTAVQDARVLKTVARLHESDAGVYATVVRQGVLRVGDAVRWAGAPGD